MYLEDNDAVKPGWVDEVLLPQMKETIRDVFKR